ncbi:interferon alpha-2 [Tupaia chinensis]|uniref:Interferon alpha-2 n=1 Tax=Tupaia chinensis TaxID=246437 RepID=L8YEC2_TUPCH|nr:interferon alpha-2 [Tupaia chinensis]ELV12736.1 Interferon alpha-2 [Tupaia chinensis]
MALQVSALLALVVVCSSPTCSLACDLPLSHGKWEIFTLLAQMERISILSCLKDRTYFGFPQILVGGHQVDRTQATAAIHETLQQIFILFSTRGSSVARNETLLEKFLQELHQRLDGLETCLGKEKEVEPSPPGSENPRLAVKSYFQRISLYLKEKKYSRCAWEIVRVEVRRCLLIINNLSGKLRKSGRH